MSTVVWGSTKSVNPAQGPIRRFLIRNRIDCTSTTMAIADTNEVLQIAAGWNVHKVWLKVTKAGTVGASTVTITDKNSHSWIVAGTLVGTTGTTGTYFETAHGDYYGSDNYADGHIYSAADYLLCALLVAAFNGILDVYASISDTNIDENASSWTD